MKIRKDFVTNSSSSNFVTAIVEGLPTVVVTFGTVAAIVSKYDPDDDNMPEYVVEVNVEGLNFHTLDDVATLDVKIYKVSDNGSYRASGGEIQVSSNSNALSFEKRANGTYHSEIKFIGEPDQNDITLTLEVDTPVRRETEVLHVTFSPGIQVKTMNDKQSLQLDEEDKIELTASFVGIPSEDGSLEAANQTLDIGLDPSWKYGEVIYFEEFDISAKGLSAVIKGKPFDQKELPKDVDVVQLPLIVTGEIDGALYTKNVTYDLAIMLSVKLSTNEVTMYQKNTEPFKLHATVEAGEELEWEFEIVQEEETYLNFEVERISNNEVDLLLTPAAVEFEGRDEYLSPELSVRAKHEETIVEEPFELSLTRELIYMDEMFENDILVLETDKLMDSYRDVLVNFSVSVWDEEQKELNYEQKCKDLKILEVHSEDAELDGLLKVIPIEMEFKSVENGGYHPVGMYAFRSKRPLAHRNKTECMGHIIVGYSEESENKCKIKTKFKTINEEVQKNKEFEIKACKSIIEKYLPQKLLGEKLDQLEEMIPYVGAREIYELRHAVWQTVLELHREEMIEYDAIDIWYEEVIYRLEWTKWIGDQAFNILVSTVASPIGGFAITNFKETTVDFITGAIGNPEPWEVYLKKFVWNKVLVLGDKSIEAYFKEGLNDELAKAKGFKQKAALEFIYLSILFLYKTLTHYNIDMDSNNQPKGWINALIEAAKDCAGSLAGDLLSESMKSSLSGNSDNALHGAFTRLQTFLQESETMNIESVTNTIKKLQEQYEHHQDRVDIYNLIQEYQSILAEFNQIIK